MISEYHTTRGNVARVIMSWGTRRRKGTEGESEPVVRAAFCGLRATGKNATDRRATVPSRVRESESVPLERAREVRLEFRSSILPVTHTLSAPSQSHLITHKRVSHLTRTSEYKHELVGKSQRRSGRGLGDEGGQQSK